VGFWGIYPEKWERLVTDGKNGLPSGKIQIGVEIQMSGGFGLVNGMV
jgi:hypothetical protein